MKLSKGIYHPTVLAILVIAVLSMGEMICGTSDPRDTAPVAPAGIVNTLQADGVTPPPKLPPKTVAPGTLLADGVTPPPKLPPKTVTPGTLLADGVTPPPKLPPKTVAPGTLLADGVTPPPKLAGKPSGRSVMTS
jgi:hypothetical protein